MPGLLRAVRAAVVAIAIGAAAAAGAAAQTATLTPDQRLAREIFAELIEIDTSPTQGTTRAADAMAARLRAAGLTDVQVLGPDVRRHNLVARLKGTGAREPLLLLAHLDVVEARREDWSVPPFRFTEQDGYFYGRGTLDDKAMAAIWVANLIRLKREGFVPDRDIIVALTADEETGDHNGVEWLLEQHPALISAAYALNEGGGGQMKQGRRLLNAVQATEKVHQSFLVEVRDDGGPSSIPNGENAIHRLANALARIEQHRFPARLNEVTRAYFTRMASVEKGRLASDMRAAAQVSPDAAALERLSAEPYLNALLRTTCTPTVLQAGHAENALPQSARATVNCRLLPGDEPAAVLAALRQVIADEKVGVRALAEARPSPASPLVPEVLGPIEAITQALWPGVPVVPVMGTGATDAALLRRSGIPVYGVSGIFSPIEDDRTHGRDERISTIAYWEAHEFLYRLVRALSGPDSE